MSKRRRPRQAYNILEIFVDPLFGAFGAFLFIFLVVILMIGVIGRKPNIMTERLPDAFHGEAYEVWLSARGGVGDYEWALSSGHKLPPELTLDPNGYLNGIPQNMDISLAKETYEFEVTVTALRLKVEDPNEAKSKDRYKVVVHRDKLIQPGELKPVKILTKSPLPDGTIGKPYNVTLAASGGISPYKWQCGQILPSKLELGRESGTISGIPGTEVKEMEFTFTVSDARKLRTADSQDTCVLKLSVFPLPKKPPPPPPPPEIVTKSLPDAIEGLLYEVGISVCYGSPPFTWTAISLPNWLRLDAKTGIMRGTPPWESRAKVAISVALKDSLGRECINPFDGELEIRPQRGAPINKLTIISEYLPEAIVNKDYLSPIALRGGVPPFHFLSDFLPKSLTLTEGGIIKGIPISTGKLNIDVTVTDSHDPAQNATASLFLVVEEQEQPLRILTESKLSDARVGKRYDLAFSAIGGNGIYKWTLQDELPDGLSLEDGYLRGKPSIATGMDAKFCVTVQSTGSKPMKADKEFSMTVLEKKDIPSIKSPKWLWLAAIFVISGITKKIWNSWCIKNAKKYGQAVWQVK